MAKVLLDFFTESRNMQFASEEDCRQIYRTFGDEEVLAKRFPLFYNALEQGRKGVDETNGDGYVNNVLVYSISYDSDAKRLQVDYNITLKQSCASLFVYIYDDSMTMYSSTFYEQTQMINAVQTFENVDLQKGQTFQLYVECPFIAGNETVLRGIRVSNQVVYNEEEPVSSIEVSAPKPKNSSSDIIKVAYGRTLGRGEIVDYTYPESRTENGNQRFFLEVGGKMQLKNQYTLKETTKAQACVMTGGQYGTITYKHPNGIVITPLENAKGFSWIADRDWCDEIANSVQYGDREYIFDLSIIFQCKETGEKNFRMHVSSYVASEKPSEYKIRKIKLYWGCLADDSKIRMADDSEKEIGQIKIGEKVKTLDGVCTVTDIVNGTEENLYCLKTEGDYCVYASILHPVLTENGFLPLRDVRQDMRILTEAGPRKVIDCYEVSREMKVCGLELEGGDSFYANGIAVGTNRIQGKMTGISPYKEHSMCQDIRKEFQKMIIFAQKGENNYGLCIKDRY